MTKAKKDKPLYLIKFLSQGEVYEVYARSVSQGDLYGFVEIEEFVFGERTEIVVDPSEEKLKNEFGSVKRAYVPIHAVLRIDEVEKRGHARITPVEGGSDKVTPFPVYTSAPDKTSK